MDPKINIKKINDLFSIITYPIKDSKNATIGFWCDGGAWKETAENNGIAHMLEHMMFKGTANYNSKQLLSKLEQLGAYTNAYTSLESVAYYLSVGPTNLVNNNKNNLMEATELLFDLFLNSTFPEEELTKEKDVVIQEIRMYQDDLEQRCHSALYEISFEKNNYLHREIIGTEEIVKSFTPQDLKNFMKNHYNKIYFVAVGNFDEKIMIDYAESMVPIINNNFTHKILPHQPSAYIPNFQQDILIKDWANQAQVMMSWHVPGDTYHREITILSLIKVILGGGMSSLLFSKIREEMGLVYGIYADCSSYKNDGIFTVHFKTFNEKVDEVIDVVNDLVKNFLNISDEQIQIAKNFILSGRIKRLETNYSKASFLGEQALWDENKLSLEEYLYECDKITRQDIEEMYNKYLNKPAEKIIKLLIK